MEDVNDDAALVVPYKFSYIRKTNFAVLIDDYTHATNIFVVARVEREVILRSNKEGISGEGETTFNYYGTDKKKCSGISKKFL